jgi:N-formylglutamate amidohydrolase
MVELRRDLYMDGTTLTPNPRYEELRTTLRDFRNALSGFCEEFQ